MNEHFKEQVDPEEEAIHTEVMAFLLADLQENEPPGWDSSLNAQEVAKLRKEVETEWSDEEICEFLEDKVRLFTNPELTRAIIDVVESKIPAAFEEDDDEEELDS